MSLAYAIAEELLNRKAMSMFVTHFPQITNLSSMYPNVQNIHLKTTINFREISDSQIARNRVIVGDHREDSNGVKSASIKFLHKINSGPCDMKTEYGIIIAEQCGLPDTVIRDAQQMRRKVRENCPVLLPQNKLVDNSLNELTRLLQHLLLLKNSTLDDEGLLNYLNNLRSQYSTETITEMLQTIDSLEMDESK